MDQSEWFIRRLAFWRLATKIKRSKAFMLRSHLYDYNDVFMVVKRNQKNKELVVKNNASFRSYK